MRNGDRPFTTPGLGDRVHSVLLGHLYSLLHNDKVTIHLTADKNDKPRKQQSWPEIISLFPDTVTYKDHDVQDLPEDEWLAYLNENGYDAENYYYKAVEEVKAYKFTGRDGLLASDFFVFYKLDLEELIVLLMQNRKSTLMR